MPGLSNGSTFPRLQLDRLGGGTLTLPDDVAGRYAVVLAYRGSWCPYCNAQLASFERAAAQLEETNVAIVAFSVDNKEQAQSLADKHHLSFPNGYGADAKRVAETLQAYHHSDPDYLESTGFVLDPQGRIVVAVYSSNAIGRLVPADVLGLIAYLQKSRAG